MPKRPFKKLTEILSGQKVKNVLFYVKGVPKSVKYG